ncbi:DNA (cytosine-5-)-methyltransferase [Planctomycetales bacterium ZRK34]|nr:DNA (cytosine-5-)-methyltransferase [Planctomycetales bacterium ZRK34]
MPSTSRSKTRKAKSSNSRKFTAAEFFAGIGLVRLALESGGDWKVIYANDIDEKKQEMYEANFKDDHFHCDDIHELDPDSIPNCDLYTASFPCNDLSVAGARAGLGGKESSAYWGLINLLEAKGENRPPLVMLENVAGFLTSHGGKDFEQALLALNKLDYTVDAFILNAVNWVPQSRVRLFVVAKQDDGSDRNAFATESKTRSLPLIEFINTHQNIRWDIRDLPNLPRTKKRLPDIVQDLPDDDEHWWNNQRAEYFMSQLSPKHEVQAKLMIGAKSISYATAFRRVRHGRSMAELRTDGIAGCLRTPRGGSGRQILFKAGFGKYKVRLLTARECARLQGVPDGYKLNGIPLNQALFGFGDAVCVPAISWIKNNYLTKVAKSIEASSLFQSVA